MSTLFTAKKIAEEALRKIGAYSINDSAADGTELNVALDWLDLLLARLSGETRIFWLVPTTLSVPLTGGTASYDLMTVLGANAPEDGIQFPISATLDDGNGNRTPLPITRRDTSEEIKTPATEGTPEEVYIDRAGAPTMTTYPVLTTGLTGYTIKLVVQTYAKSFAEGDGVKATGMRAAWQCWAIDALAHKLGSGVVRRLPNKEIEMLKNDAKDAKKELLAFENREHESYPHRAAYHDSDIDMADQSRGGMFGNRTFSSEWDF